MRAFLRLRFAEVAQSCEALEGTMTTELVLQAGGATHVASADAQRRHVSCVRDTSPCTSWPTARRPQRGRVASLLCARSMSNYFGATIRSTHESPEFNRFGIPNGARRLSAAVLKANRTSSRSRIALKRTAAWARPWWQSAFHRARA